MELIWLSNTETVKRYIHIADHSKQSTIVSIDEF